MEKEGQYTGDDANVGRKVERGDNSRGKGEGTEEEWKRVEKRARKRRHIGNNEGEGYVCVALSV